MPSDRTRRRPCRSRARQAGGQPGPHRDGAGHRVPDGRRVTVSNDHRGHAVRVAAVVTLIVMVAYVVTAVVLNLVVTNHLVGTADARLSDRLTDAQNGSRTLPGSTSDAQSEDVDDAPLFLWAVAADGVATPLTPSAPTLPARRWGTGPVTLNIGASSFRFDTLRARGTVLVGDRAWRGHRMSNRPCWGRSSCSEPSWPSPPSPGQPSSASAPPAVRAGASPPSRVHGRCVARAADTDLGH